jgi:ATP-dependent DNA ligase
MLDFNYFAELEPQKYYENKDDTPSARAKREAMLSNKNNEYVITEKHDGEWSMSIIAEDRILVRSRSRGVNGSFGNFTDKIPHIVEELKGFPAGIVLLGELCYLDYSKTSKDVGSILRCLTPKAISRQLDESMKLHLVIFDCLACDGNSMLNEEYNNRLILANDLVQKYAKHYIHITKIQTENFESFVDAIWDAGGEGGVIQRKNAKYASGARPSWQSLKVKKHLDEIEVPVIAVNPPTREYSGKDSANWQFKDSDGNLVTKYFFNGWAGGITVNYKGKNVSISSGLSDDDREWLSTSEATEMIKSSTLYAVISAMEETEDGSLRHPILKRLRTEVK